MKKLIFIFLLSIISPSLFAQQDMEGSKDHPMFPNRMTNYLISGYSNNFDAVPFNLAADESKMITKEGTKTFLRYDFNTESGQQKPSVLQILRNYENASKKIGGITMFFRAEEDIAVFKINKSSKEVWVRIITGGDNGNDFYELTIVELEAMKQEITSTDILTALNTDGHIALYINFDSGKSDIKSESQPIIDQLAEMMKANANLKINIEGHTDNIGSADGNKTLSLNRAKAVMSAIVSKGISASLLSSLGWGQEKPVADNRTEEGRAKNRRVEIVKK